MRPTVHLLVVDLSGEVSTPLRTVATKAQSTLDSLQEGLRAPPAQAATPSLDARDAARVVLIEASEALSAALAEDWASHFPEITGLDAWSRFHAEAHQLAIWAAECKRVVDAAEPKRSMDALQVLQESRSGLRRKVDTASAQIVLLKDEVASSPRGAGQDLRRMRSTAEQREAKNALLAQPMEGWTEAQVQEWERSSACLLSKWRSCSEL